MHCPCQKERKKKVRRKLRKEKQQKKINVLNYEYRIYY